jgi:hypothetical protein
MNSSSSGKGKEQGKDTYKKTKLSNAPFIILIILAFGLLGYQWYKYHKQQNEMSAFMNYVPYIAQSVYINIYATQADYPKYQWLFKGTLLHSILVSNGQDYVMVPKTLVDIPIRVYSNAPQTSFTITANGIEQPLLGCDFTATTF